ncbi:FABP family protein [Streptomyces sp. NPDC091268]|uniref:FABP family protein n=1 Tax=Streptomyces sp. NPDC091268 TaxID=3365979 RepID=UPI00380B6091
MLESVQENPYPESCVLGEGPDLHPWLKPVAPFLGRWRGRGRGGYPTLAEDFQYEQEIAFSHDGRPFLRYEARAWLIDGAGTAVRPSGREVGWWRVTPEGYAEVLMAHPTGIVETYVGQVSGPQMEMETKDVARTPLAKEVAGSRRRYTVEGGELIVVQELEAMGQPMQQHLVARLRAQSA